MSSFRFLRDWIIAMAFVPAPNVAKFALVQSLSGQLVVNTLYALDGSGWDETKLTTTAQALYNWWAGHLAVPLTANLSLTAVEARDLTSQDGAVATYAGVPASTGGGGVEYAAANLSLCISFRSGLAGRSRRGRNYVAGLPEDVTSLSTVTQAFADAIKAAYDRLLDGGVSPLLPATWVVVSTVSDGVQRQQALITPITSTLVVDLVIDSQRRRLPGRGA